MTAQSQRRSAKTPGTVNPATQRRRLQSQLGGGGHGIHREAQPHTDSLPRRGACCPELPPKARPQLRILTEGGNWEQSSGHHQGGRAGRKHKVGRERQRQHKARHAGPQTPTSEPLGSAAAKDAVYLCKLAFAHTHVP